MNAVNPLIGWRVDPAQMTQVGQNLNRPECVLATRSGRLWVADGRGGIMRIDPDGRQALIVATGGTPDAPGTRVPNGIALMRDSRIMIANLTGSAIEAMDQDGGIETLLTDVEGRTLGQTNFVLRDRKDRTWITVSSQTDNPLDGFLPGHASGYIALLEPDGRARVVADGFANTNEVRIDDRGEWLYVVETGGRCIWRLQIAEDGSLTGRERFGPVSLGYGFPDGIAFDSFGNLWCTMFLAERLIALSPDGELLELLDLGQQDVNEEGDRRYANRGFDFPFIHAMTRKADARLLASLTFGGPDLKTVYVGTIAGTSLLSFRAPVAGQALAHWMA